MGTRAYQASRAGIEWAAYNVASQPVGTQWPGCATYTVPNTLFTVGDLAGSFSPFQVTLTFSAASAVEGVATIYVYGLTSTAVNGGAPGNPDYVERVLSVKMGR